MPITQISQFAERLEKNKRRRVAVIGANDINEIKAIIEVKSLVDSLLIGDKQKITDLLRELGENPTEYWIENSIKDKNPVIIAAELIHKGEVDFLMKGKIMSAEFLQGVLSKESNLRTDRLMSAIAIFKIPNYEKMVCITDGGMCVYPSLEEKKQIILNAVELLHVLDYEKPVVAALCALEVVNPKMPETIDAAKLNQMSKEGELGECYVEGPISYDIAMSKSAAQAKGYHINHIGNFDVLMVPNIVTGNVLIKSLVIHGGASGAGVVWGSRVPIVLTSRGTGFKQKTNSIIFAASLCK